ncbi:hypothetical protein Anapl_04067 [Anas platyrhynchos]|uniref:Uncharacterized protein n=1 Tax=Anas platyrhynchos TaxID=8839 RepID=R0K1J4_ANAPL|nr:hypothetical protein Anapl_04067 [Anas platyrhynchos]
MAPGELSLAGDQGPEPGGSSVGLATRLPHRSDREGAGSTAGDSEGNCPLRSPIPGAGLQRQCQVSPSITITQGTGPKLRAPPITAFTACAAMEQAVI